MDLAEQIAQMINHLDFARLCNAVFTALYPTEFQVIDGTRSDQGNDGYVLSERMMLAYHCPTKPEQKTDKKYIEKIESDLNKAHKLHLDKHYEVRKWAFITPRALSNTVVTHMRKQAKNLGIDAISLESTFLADALSRNRELLHRFPFLQIPTIEYNLKEIHRLLKMKDTSKAEPSGQAQNISKPKTVSDDFRQVMEIRAREQAADSKTQLRTIFYKTTDLYAQANAVLGLLQWFDPMEDRLKDMVEWCNRGIVIFQQLGDKSHEAYFRAHKGHFLSAMYTIEDMHGYFSIRVDQIMGIQTVTEAHKQSGITRLRHIEDSFTTEFNSALKIIEDIGDLNMWGEILLSIGNSAGERAIHFLAVGLHDQAEKEKDVAISALLAAKEAFAKCGNELSVGYAIYDMANQLRFLGEPKEALTLLKSVAEIADKHGDFRLEQGARLLKTTIESGKIPDYMHGERIERKK